MTYTATRGPDGFMLVFVNLLIFILIIKLPVD